MTAASFPSDKPGLSPPRRAMGSAVFKDRRADPYFYIPKDEPKAQAGSQAPISTPATYIPDTLLTPFKTYAGTLLLHELSGVISKACRMIGETKDIRALDGVPYLNLITAPFYLYQTGKQSYERLNLMADAASADRVSEAFFYGFKSFDSVTCAIANLAKGVTGGITIAGFADKLLAGICFTTLLPIILMVGAFVGGVAEGWSLWRNMQTLKAYNQKDDGSKESVDVLFETLNFLRGEHFITAIDGKEDAASRVDFNKFATTHFTSEERFKAVKSKIDETLSAKQKELREEWVLLQGVQKSFQSIFEGEPEISQIDRLLEQYKRAQKLVPARNTELLQTFADNVKKLEEFRDLLLKEGNEIVDTVRAEIHRNILYNVIFLLIAGLVLAAGVIYYFDPSSTMVANCLSIASTFTYMIYIVFDKKVSQAQFLQLERSLGIINVGLLPEHK